MSKNTATPYRVLPMFTAYGSAIANSGAIVRATAWELYNPRTGQKVSLENCPANLCTFHAYLKASWTLTNEDESLAGYAEPAATRSLKTDGRAAMETDGLRPTENESE